MAEGPVSWQSVRWPDGSTYEGIVAEEHCHLRGVFKYPRGDRYEGEYFANQMSGFGVYVWRDGTVYRGQWKDSAMHGCGVKISRQPNGEYLAEEGQFLNDEWVGNVMACSVDQARAAAAEADRAAMLARAFELEPERGSGSSSGNSRQEAISSAKAGTSQKQQRASKRRQQQQQQEPPLAPADVAAAASQKPDWAPLAFLRSLIPK